jgi:hypothetical protein
MTTALKHADQIGRRGELLAELFLQELEPEFVAQATAEDFAFDFLIGFANRRAGINSYAVEVKATEQPVADEYQIERPVFDRLANSNIPVLLLVVDVKRNELFFAWPTDQLKVTRGRNSVRVPVVPIDDDSKSELRARMTA